MKSIKLAFAFVAFSQVFLSQNAGAQESSEAGAGSLLKRGEELAKFGHWQKASLVFRQACQQDPASVSALHDLAVSLAHTNKLAEAAECERKALSLDEKHVPSHIELSYVLGKQDDKNGAWEHLNRALELDPDNKIARKNLQAIMNLSRFHRPAAAPSASGDAPAAAVRTEASEEAKERVMETPVSRALIVRGANMYRQGKVDLSRRFFEQALENCPDSALAHACLGVVRGTSGDIEGQVKEERLALLLQPKDASILANLAWGLARQGDLDEALSTYQKALSVQPDQVDAQAGQGILLYKTGRSEAALAVLKESMRLNPELPLLHLALAAVLQAVERTDEAVAEYQEALRLAPNNQEVKSRLAAAYLTCDRFDKAKELYSQLVEHTPAAAELRIGLGLALTRMNEVNAAYQQFKKAAELDRNLAAAHACLSMVEEIRGCLTQAENEARLALEKDPESKFFQESAERLAKSRKESQM
jgi:tetratricopeptide (TPR) repeat protein